MMQRNRQHFHHRQGRFMTQTSNSPASEKLTPHPAGEQSVPFFWPLAAALKFEEGAFHMFENNLEFLSEALKVNYPPKPEWATPNNVRLDLATMQLRDFSVEGNVENNDDIPVLVDAPYAGHSSTIADYDKGQSLVETLLASGLKRVFVTDWKAATQQMRYFDIDTYLAQLNAAIDDLGGCVHLIGLCQGGWLSTMLAARFPHKVKSLVLAGSPIDTDAGNGPIKKLAHSMPLQTYERMVALGEGLMLGRVMLAGWKNMHFEDQYVSKYLDLYQNIENKNYLARTEKFESWYEHSINLPGAYYLQAIQQLFKENRLAKNQFVALGRRLNLQDVKVPVYLLAGEADDITTSEQVFAAEKLLGTPTGEVMKTLAPGGHIGLFMGSKTLKDVWPGIGEWIGRHG